METEKYKINERRIEKPFPYVVLSDLDEVLGRIGVIQAISGKYQQEINKVLWKASPEGTSFYQIRTAEVNKMIFDRLENMKQQDQAIGIVYLDRYLSQRDELGNSFDLNLSRGVDGGLMPRPGAQMTVVEQMEALMTWIQNGKYKKLILVDDVLAFGDTLTPIIKSMQTVLPETEIEVLVGMATENGGWRGVNRVKEETGVEVDSIYRINAGDENEWTSGMAMPASRDFTYFGGKVKYLDDHKVDLSFPYFAPFSVPQLSFMEKQKRMSISSQLMNISLRLAQEIDGVFGQKITIGEYVEAGFGIPMSRLECLQDKIFMPSPDDLMINYLAYFEALLRENYQEVTREMLA